MRENARPGAALLCGKSIARRAATKRNGEDKPMMGTDIAIDLGTANFKLFVDGRGVVINEPNVVAVDTYSDRIVAIGREAREMLGRTSERVRVVKPMRGGVISDFSLMDAMLRHYLKQVCTSRVFMPRVVVTVPSGITEVEKRAVVDAVAANGVRKICLLEGPAAAAIGAGVDITRPRGTMVVTLGVYFACAYALLDFDATIAGTQVIRQVLCVLPTAIASLILALLCVNMTDRGFVGILVWLLVMILIPEIFRYVGYRVDAFARIADWMPGHFMDLQNATELFW